MLSLSLKNYLPQWDTHQSQTNNIVMITFWSQFSVYALHAVMILFLTRPMLMHGLGYSQEKAYAFIGISHATGYLMPVLGGFMADKVLGVRRAILFGSLLLAFAYLLILLSGYTIVSHGDSLFIAAYALLPAASSLLMGTSSSMVSHIYAKEPVKAKTAMTFYYMAINVGALLSVIIAPSLLESSYGPLSVLTLAFVGKSIAALNFAKHYALYDNVVWGKDRLLFPLKSLVKVMIYFLLIYCFTLYAYFYVYSASIIIASGCILGILWFLKRTLTLTGSTRVKQLVALLLIIEAIVFFVIYNQMNSTLVLFAKYNTNLELLGIAVSPAQYQMLNPLLIIAIGTQLPRFYRRFPNFTIPFQFAAGTLLAAIALLFMAFVANTSETGYINGNYLGLTYILITLAELWVSAIGLSMIGLYCNMDDIAFAMGVWYLASSLSNAISGRLASFVALPGTMTSPMESLVIYQHYYFALGCCALFLGIIMGFIAISLRKRLKKQGVCFA